MADILALSVRQPWAWAIATGQKAVENRTWHTNYLGPVAIHASKTIDYGAELPPGRARTKLRAVRAEAVLAGELTEAAKYLRLGLILAMADLVAIHHARDAECYSHLTGQTCSPWAVPGQYHWVLENVRALPAPVPCKGRLGLWKLPEGVQRAVRGQLGSTGA